MKLNLFVYHDEYFELKYTFQFYSKLDVANIQNYSLFFLNFLGNLWQIPIFLMLLGIASFLLSALTAALAASLLSPFALLTLPSSRDPIIVIIFSLKTFTAFFFPSSLVGFVVLPGHQEHSSHSSTSLFDTLLVAQTVRKQHEEDSDSDKDPCCDANGAFQSSIVVGKGRIPSLGGCAQSTCINSFALVRIWATFGVKINITGPRIFQKRYNVLSFTWKPIISSINLVTVSVNLEVVSMHVRGNFVEVVSIAVIIIERCHTESTVLSAPKCTGGSVSVAVAGSISSTPFQIIIIIEVVRG